MLGFFSVGHEYMLVYAHSVDYLRSQGNNLAKNQRLVQKRFGMRYCQGCVTFTVMMMKQ